MRKSFLTMGALCGALCFGAGLARATTVLSTTTYTFSGICTDCTSPTGSLVLKSTYTPGTTFSYSSGDSPTATNFVQFTYSSSVFTMGGAAAPINAYPASTDVFSITGNVGTGADTLRFYDQTTGIYFLLGAGGDWCAGNAAGDLLGNHPAQDCTVVRLATSVTDLDRGIKGTFTNPAVGSTPEPGGLALIGTGMAFAGAVRRRWKR